jgi:ribonuclease BN (tRNA processing enzyme)
MGWLGYSASAQPINAPTLTTQVVMLGTGTPGPDPDRSGPATAIVVNATPYLVDFGPGVVRRAKAAVIEKGVKALEPVNLRVAFATHLHSDHTVGYPDLILTPWVIGRRVPVEVYGPKGIKAMTQHILAAYDEDIKARTRPDGNQHGFPQGSWVNAHEIAAGVVYKDENVTVTAFPTKHALESYGYRFDSADRSIVITGDTAPTQATIDACNGCDILIHEVNTLTAVAARRPPSRPSRRDTTPRPNSLRILLPRRNLVFWSCITPQLWCDLACGQIFRPTRRSRSFSKKCNRATPARS